MGERFTMSQKVLTDFFKTKGQQDHTNNQKSIRKTPEPKAAPRTTAEAAGVIWVQRNWSRKKDGQKGLTTRQLSAVWSASPQCSKKHLSQSQHT